MPQKTEIGPGFYRFVMALVIGFIALIAVIAGASYLSAPAKISPNKIASNVNSTAAINVEITTFGKIALTMYIDGKSETDINDSPHTSTYKAQNNFTLIYSIYHVDNFQLKINGKVIKLSKVPPLGSYESKFEITKDNLYQIMQKGSN